jgi:hypothetical protein
MNEEKRQAQTPKLHSRHPMIPITCQPKPKAPVAVVDRSVQAFSLSSFSSRFPINRHVSP